MSGMKLTPIRPALLLVVALPFAGTAAAAGETPPYVAQLALLLVVSAGVAFVFFRLGVTPIVGFAQFKHGYVLFVVFR